jgi:hypothetical protein
MKTSPAGGGETDTGVPKSPRPGLVKLDEAGLDKILGGVPVAGEQDGQPQVALAVPAYESGETFIEVAGLSAHPSLFLLTVA